MKSSAVLFGEQHRKRIFIFVAVAIGIVCVCYFRFHLIWQIQSRWRHVRDVQPIRAIPMPQKFGSENWVRCANGSIEVSLPHEIAQNKIANPRTPDLVFRHGGCEIIVCEPFEHPALMSDYIRMATSLSPKGEQFSWPRLLYAWYQTSAHDFRWSMTPQEVRWFSFCVFTGKMYRSNISHIEYFFREDIDGIAEFDGRKVWFSWQCTKSGLCGTILFLDREGTFGPDRVRSVCQSVKISR